MQTIKATIKPMQRISAKIRAASAGRGGDYEVVNIEDIPAETMEVSTAYAHYNNTLSGTSPMTYYGVEGVLSDYKIYGKSNFGNLLEPSDKTIDGITYTSDGDYYIASPDSQMDNRNLNESNADLQLELTAGTYILAFSGTPSTIYTSSAGFALFFDGRNLLGQLLNQAEQHYQFTIPSDGTVYLLTKRFDSRYKIMICREKDWNGTVTAYTGTVKKVGDLQQNGRYKIPVTINNVTANIELDAPLGAGESISYLPDMNIPQLSVYAGQNILSVETEIKPGNIEITGEIQRSDLSGLL